MSFRVLLIPEDPTWNGYIIRPLIEAMLNALGKPNADVMVLGDPKLNGIDHALSTIRSEEFQDRYRHMDIWIFLPDSDRVNQHRAASIVEEIRSKGINFFCCPAQPEIEIWLLAGYSTRLGIDWASVRTHPRLKEEIFEPFLDENGDKRAVGRGRKELMIQALQSLKGLFVKCPELQQLSNEISEYLVSVTTQ